MPNQDRKVYWWQRLPQGANFVDGDQLYQIVDPYKLYPEYTHRRKLKATICKGCSNIFFQRIYRSAEFCHYGCKATAETQATNSCPWRVRFHSRFLFYYAQTWHEDYGWIAVHTLKARLAGHPSPLIAHHRNGKTLDNSNNNLEFMTQADHVRIHKPVEARYQR